MNQGNIFAGNLEVIEARICLWFLLIRVILLYYAIVIMNQGKYFGANLLRF